MTRILALLALFAAPRLAFGGGGNVSPPPPPAPVPPPPMLQSPQGLAAADTVRRRASAMQGYGSTIITGPMGDPTPPATRQNALLGGG